MMKKIIWTWIGIASAGLVLFTGCGAQTTQETASVPETQVAAESVAESEEVMTAEENVQAADVLPDGTYLATFKTDSSMFHVNESCDGKGTLTVADGKMMIHVSLVSKNIVNLYSGMAEDAEEDETNWLLPTEDEVTYDDGYTEVVYGFDIPVPNLDQEFDLALLGAKGTWYDHKVTVSEAELIE